MGLCLDLCHDLGGESSPNDLRFPMWVNYDYDLSRKYIIITRYRVEVACSLSCLLGCSPKKKHVYKLEEVRFLPLSLRGAGRCQSPTSGVWSVVGGWF